MPCHNGTTMPHPILSLSAADAEDDPRLLQALLDLNNADAEALSFLTPGRLHHLLRHAFLARRIGGAEGLLLAFDQAAEYDSPNFLWFRARLPRFVYVDRVVVAACARRHGHARRLYQELLGLARQAGHDTVVCEVNADPPNPVSDAFHAGFGFSELGVGRLDGGRKTVRYLRRTIR